MLEISQNASEHLAHLLAEKGGDGLRLTVEKGGCAGLQYVLAVDSQHQDDHIFECGGGRIFIDQKSLSQVAGSTLDYEEGLHGAGFRIQNPRATRSCGCGTSFEPKAEGSESSQEV